MGLSKNWFVFDGVDSRDFGVYLFAKEILGAPARRRETISVPGRSGDLIRDEKSFENKLIRYSVVIIKDALTGMRDLSDFLLSRGGYARLEDTYNRDEYYMAVLSGGIEPVASTDQQLAKAELVFERQPQRWLKIGEEDKSFTAAGSLENPTWFPAYPLLRIYGNGTATVNGYTVTVANNASNYVDVDCEAQDAYKGSTNRNADITLNANYEFPVLGTGTNNVALSGISRIDVTPRWWRL